jgi:hypothetical protein
MAARFDRAVDRFIARCACVRAVHDLVTKWRLELSHGHVLDLYYNESLDKYGYTLIVGGARVLGWDNAPHHPELDGFPHHVHRLDGRVEPSSLTGDPESDLDIVRNEVEAYLNAMN